MCEINYVRVEIYHSRNWFSEVNVGSRLHKYTIYYLYMNTINNT
jgi:hypothetical protein